MNKTKFTAIMAIADDGTIGDKGMIPWYISEDFKRFKKLTMGKPLIMGRKTFESLPGILPGRRHVVLTRDINWTAEGVEVANSVIDAVNLVLNQEVFVIGGSEILEIFNPFIDEYEITEVHQNYNGDTKFHLPFNVGKETFREHHPATDTTPAYDFVTYSRIENENS